MKKFILSVCIAACCCGSNLARAQEKSAEQQKIQELTAQVEQLQAEVQKLRAENAQLLERLAALDKSRATTKPVEPPSGEKPRMTLGAPATLGAYQYNAPDGWVSQSVKDNPLSVMYRSTDKSAAILLRVRPKGGAVPEMQGKFAESIIGLLKQDFAKSKTEVLEPPNVQRDNRFFLKIREKIKTKQDKIATQLHSYRNLNRDMIELTAITTSDSPDEVTAFHKLADEILLSFKNK